MTLTAKECKAGSEQYVSFLSTVLKKNKNLVQFDYRHTDGTLFSCVRPTLDQCRKARDYWLEAKGELS